MERVEKERRADPWSAGRGQSHKVPLPAQIRKMREKTYSVFVSNLPHQLSNAEVEAIFWRAGRIQDVFIPKDKRDNSNRGFAFVRFATLKKAETAAEMAEGKVWGGRKLQANLAQFCPNTRKSRGEETTKRDWKAFRQSSFWGGEHHTGEVQHQRSRIGEEARSNKPGLDVVGWIVEEDTRKGVRVAQWVVRQQKRFLVNSLVGFLKEKSVSIEQIESWIQKCCGRLIISILNDREMDEQVVWLQLYSSREVDEFLLKALGDSLSPFSMIERWMEILGTALNPIWVKVKGVPLQAWHEGVFRLIGDCAGKTVEVDKRTREMEALKEGRVQVLLNSSTTLPLQVPIWVDDLKFLVTVEREEEGDKLMGEEVRNGLRQKEHQEVRRCNRKALQGKREEDDDVSPTSNFKSSALLLDRDGPTLNLDKMGQDRFLDCKLLKARG